jgi:hypothetical protein
MLTFAACTAVILTMPWITTDIAAIPVLGLFVAGAPVAQRGHRHRAAATPTHPAMTSRGEPGILTV